MSKIKSVVAAIFVMALFSLAFFYMYGTAETVKEEDRDFYIYNKYTFVKSGALWRTQVQAPGTNIIYTVYLHYGPKEVEDVPMDGPLSEKFINANYAYISVDPPIENNENRSQMSLAAAELSRVLFVAVKRDPIASCTKNLTDACVQRPIIPCEFKGEPVIYLKNEGSAAIEFKGDCVVISGENEEMVRAVDRLLLYWLGIQRQRVRNMVPT